MAKYLKKSQANLLRRVRDWEARSGENKYSHHKHKKPGSEKK